MVFWDFAQAGWLFMVYMTPLPPPPPAPPALAPCLALPPLAAAWRPTSTDVAFIFVSERVRCAPLVLPSRRVNSR